MKRNGRILSGVIAAALVMCTAAPAALAGDDKQVKKERQVVFIRDGHLMELGGDDGPVFGALGMLGGGYLGVGLTDLTSELRSHFGAPPTAGVMVSKVSADSPAARAGIRVGDVIASVDGQPVDSAFDLGRAVRQKKANEQVKLGLLRDGRAQTVTATVVEREGLPKVISIDPELREHIEVRTGEAMKKMEKYFDSPEWKEKVESMRDCERVQERIRELEGRLQELEKKLAK